MTSRYRTVHLAFCTAMFRDFFIVILIFIICWPVQLFSATPDSCEIGELLISLENQDPVTEAKMAYASELKIFLGVYGYNLFVPGIKADVFCLVDAHKIVFIPDTTYAVCSDEHSRLQDVAIEFARQYNLTILNLAGEGIIGDCGA